ncbi:hypothetical protein [Methylocapsa palsarum]|uniref:Uncharacterized protein n=1 Tax=Methylocapsa palsarum TaxID=1612308 RepID=A0A1I3Z6M1_9HYPH|nr:hypothetical protein [Methylocapsa palsarum]SFK39341.1 hypothetical protein SAMN05444581_10790 [Methylocapsa palsarum]
MANQFIDQIIPRETEHLRSLLEAAFEAGRAAEREAMKRQLLAVLSPSELNIENVPMAQTGLDTVSQRGPLADEHIAATHAETRAQPGTVKPVIKGLIETAKNGILTSTIIERTGFKENSVRGTLSALKSEGFAERRGDLWFVAPDQDRSKPEETFADEEFAEEDEWGEPLNKEPTE